MKRPRSSSPFEIRRSGVILDLVSVTLLQRNCYVMNIQEDAHVLSITCNDSELKNFVPGDSISFILNDESCLGTEQEVKPKLAKRSRLVLTRFPPLKSFLDSTKAYDSDDWRSEVKRLFGDLTTESRRFLDSIAEEEEFKKAFDLCRLTIKVALCGSGCDDVAEKIDIKRESLKDLVALEKTFCSTNASGKLGIDDRINGLLLESFKLLGHRSDLTYQLSSVLEYVEDSLARDECKINGIDEYDWRMSLPIDDAVDSVVKACRFKEAAMLYRVGVVLLLKDNPSSFFEDALAAKKVEHDEVKKRLQDLEEVDDRLESELRDKHEQLCDRISDLEDQGKHLIFLICDDEELQQRLAGDVISFLLEDELSPGTVKTIQPVLLENSYLGLGGNPPILSFFDHTKDFGSAEWTSELDRRFGSLTDESRQFLELIPEEPAFKNSMDLCRLTIATSLIASKCDQVIEEIATRKKSLDELQNLFDKFNSIEGSEQLGINEKINVLLINFFLLLDFHTQYFFQLEYIVEAAEGNLISAERREQEEMVMNDEEELQEEKELEEQEEFEDEEELDEGEELQEGEHLEEEEELEDEEYNRYKEEFVDRVLKACRYGQIAMLYRVGVVLLLKDSPSDFFEAAMVAKQAEHNEVLDRLKELREEDERLESELRAKYKEMRNRINELVNQGTQQSVADRFAEALLTIRPEFRTQLQRFDS
uniref:Protein kinase domain-containing protein n=1 Tax=Steinernema glaseri TaxID=37863 RepID=A0A1I8ABG3_9BILA